MEPKRPNFLIIGSAKCGTTSLAAILDQHPDVCMSRPKEVSFFQDNVDYMPNQNYEKGWDWYKAAFSHYNGEKLVGDATPSYSDRSRSPNTAKRIFEFNSEMKIIYMLRNPKKRQISAWKMQYAASKTVADTSLAWKVEYEWASKGFKFWLEKQKEVKQWDECRYNYQLDAYRAYFINDQIHVSFLEDWLINQSNEVSTILNFLNIDNKLTLEQLSKKENTGDTRGIETRFLKKIRDSAYLNPVKKILPFHFKQKISQKALTKEIEYPEIPKGSLNEFNEYIKKDTVALFKTYNKDQSFWDLG